MLAATLLYNQLLDNIARCVGCENVSQTRGPVLCELLTRIRHSFVTHDIVRIQKVVVVGLWLLPSFSPHTWHFSAYVGELVEVGAFVMVGAMVTGAALGAMLCVGAGEMDGDRVGAVVLFAMQSIWE